MAGLLFRLCCIFFHDQNTRLLWYSDPHPLNLLHWHLFILVLGEKLMVLLKIQISKLFTSNQDKIYSTFNFTTKMNKLKTPAFTLHGNQYIEQNRIKQELWKHIVQTKVYLNHRCLWFEQWDQHASSSVVIWSVKNVHHHWTIKYKYVKAFILLFKFNLLFQIY